MTSTQATTSRPSRYRTWEEAYLAFLTPGEEMANFAARLEMAGAAAWPRDARVLELFCGRGTGLATLSNMGFGDVTGLDLSHALLKHAQAGAAVTAADCRSLPFAAASFDIVVSQDGLHHLPVFPPDVRTTLAEARRVLKPGGMIVILEPWLTPRLRLFMAVSAMRIARRMSSRLDAFATMVDMEYPVYHNWLARPAEALELFRTWFDEKLLAIRPGQAIFVGARK